MKKKLLIILVLLALFAIFLVGKYYFFDREAVAGRLRILSSPGAGVFIDGVSSGKTPHEASLKPGEYQIKLIPEGEGTKTVSWEGKVTVNENALTFVSRELGTSDLTSAGEVLTISKMKDKPNGDVGEVAVETDPTGGIVFLDGDQKGISPLRMQDVPSGDHEISVFLPGFFRRSQKIHIEKAHTLNASFKLSLDQSHKTLEEEVADKEKAASAEAAKKEASESAKADTEKTDTKEDSTSGTLKILDTPTGYLNVRDEPSISGKVVTKVDPGKEFKYTDVQSSWYKISAAGEEGWVAGQYVEVQ